MFFRQVIIVISLLYSFANSHAETLVAENTPQPPVSNQDKPQTYEPKTNNTESGSIGTDDNIKTGEETKPQTRWLDTQPKSVSADWVQLKSGEWLRGHITVLQKESLEFDSDELDLQEIDLDKIKYLISSEPYSLRFDNNKHAIGKFEMNSDTITIRSDYDTIELPRSSLLTIASGRETEISYWASKITLSLNIRRGNTDQTDFQAKFNAKRRTTDSRFTMDYLGNATTIDSATTINNHRINSSYDIFLTRDIFWSPAIFEYYRDPFQNIDSKVSYGLGIGYSIINTGKTEWDIGAGPGYQKTRFVSVENSSDSNDSTFTLHATTFFDTEINSKVDMNGTYSATLGDSKSGNYTHHSLLTVETEITDRLDFDVTGVWDYVRSPVTNDNGNTPEKSDFKLLVGLGFDL